MTVRYQVTGATAAEISASVESGIRAGALPPGAGLPPVRTLATALGLSPATVASAYRGLRQRGLVETGGRRGTRVRPRPPLAASRAARRPRPPAGVRDLSTGEPDLRLLPDLAPQLRRLAAAGLPPSGYRDTGAVPELVELARARFAADRVPSAAAITVTSGALDGIERLLAAYLRPGDRVAVEDPGWANLLDLVAALGLEPVAVPVDEAGPEVAGLRRALLAGARAAVLTTRAQNPTGATVSRVRAAALRRELVRHPDLLLIEDDHAAELAAGSPHPLAGATGRWAFVRSLSKPYGPDLRVAVIAGDDVTVARVDGRLRAGAGWVSTLLQRLVVELWRDPAVADRVATARESYARRRAGLIQALSAAGVPATGHSGINVWVPVPDETAAVTRLWEAGYAVSPGALYRLARDRGSPAVRITVSSLAETDLVPLANAVAAAVDGTTAAPGA